MNKNTRYGFPISSIFFQLCGMILLILLVVLTLSLKTFVFTSLLVGSLIVFWYLFIYLFRKRFFNLREKILRQMIDHANVKGSEYILDLGTGAGYIAVGFSKILSSAQIIGVDKFDQNKPVFKIGFFEKIKINFFGNTVEQAKKNVTIEKAQDAVQLVKSDLQNHFPFIDHVFDTILSSQFLYCISQKKINEVLSEIDRVLKPSGKLIFFESKKFINWDIAHIDSFFKNKNYVTRIYQLEKMPNKCIFSAKKPR
ncbi:MAG: class I SAM-dependent methyltransferase [Candidatus Thermoplasmatota archaeon]|nr:class I SAM-dependent methyltransferase [Candidatus Thermoplasmatota archaeon]